LDNASTNERLTIKTIRPPPMYRYMHNNVVQILRYPMDATKEWIEANEKEIKEWKFDKETSRCIRFERSLGW
jgi:ABC-type proline/glycine betaine transport system substrate-binding protein